MENQASYMAGYLLFGVLDTNYVMNTICIGYAMNELISIMENAGLMGLPLPDVIVKASLHIASSSLTIY